MVKNSLWKRTVEWFRGPQQPVGKANIVNLNAEGLLIEPENSAQDEQDSALAPRLGRKDQQLVTMEDGFGRLVDVLESINDNVVRQGEQNVKMNSRLEELARSLPELAREQKGIILNISKQLHNQTLTNSQLAELLKDMPDLQQGQVNRLGEIKEQVEISAETAVRMAESFNRFDGSLQGVANQSKAQTVSLANIGNLLEQKELNLQKTLAKQNRRFAWLVGLAVLIILAAIAVLILLIFNDLP